MCANAVFTDMHDANICCSYVLAASVKIGILTCVQDEWARASSVSEGLLGPVPAASDGLGDYVHCNAQVPGCCCVHASEG